LEIRTPLLEEIVLSDDLNIDHPKILLKSMETPQKK
jgi:hypothetical protein